MSARDKVKSNSLSVAHDQALDGASWNERYLWMIFLVMALDHLDVVFLK